MKAVMITFDQAHYDRIVEMLEHLACRGFTAWQEVQGRGTLTGDPHYGSHAWPSISSAIIAMVKDDRVDDILAELKRFDEERPLLGLRAFVWNIEKAY